MSFSPVSYLEYPVCDIPKNFATCVWVKSASSRSSRMRKPISFSYSFSDSVFSEDSTSSTAARTAATTNAENVQSLLQISASTLSIKSLGKRTVLFVVGGIEGILKAITKYTSQCNHLAFSLLIFIYFICIAFVFSIWYDSKEVILCRIIKKCMTRY